MKRSLAKLLTLAAVGAMTFGAHAVSINNLNFADSSYVGWIERSSPSGPEQEATFINTLTGVTAGTFQNLVVASIDTDSREYNRLLPLSTLAGTLPTADPLSTDKNEMGYDDQNPDDAARQLDAEHQYILAKYGHRSYVWFNAAGFGGPGDLVQVPALDLYDGDMNAVSHVSGFNSVHNSVPENGQTIILAGIAALGLAVMRKRLV
jgi:hypothetical protein